VANTSGGRGELRGGGELGGVYGELLGGGGGGGGGGELPTACPQSPIVSVTGRVQRIFKLQISLMEKNYQPEMVHVQ
jgi:hypothetical protein